MQDQKNEDFAKIKSAVVSSKIIWTDLTQNQALYGLKMEWLPTNHNTGNECERCQVYSSLLSQRLLT